MAKYISEMTKDELTAYAYDLQARLQFLADNRDHKPLLKNKIRNHMVRDIISDDPAFQDAYAEIEEGMHDKVKRLVTDRTAEIQEAISEFVYAYFRKANPAIVYERNKRSGTSTAWMTDAFNALHLDRFTISQNTMTRTLKLLQIRKDKGVSLYPEPDDYRNAVCQCALGIFPTEALMQKLAEEKYYVISE